MTVGCGTLNVRYGEALGLFDHLTEILVIDLSHLPEVPNMFKMMIEEQAADTPGISILIAEAEHPLLQQAGIDQCLEALFCPVLLVR